MNDGQFSDFGLKVKQVNLSLKINRRVAKNEIAKT